VHWRREVCEWEECVCVCYREGWPGDPIVSRAHICFGACFRSSILLSSFFERISPAGVVDPIFHLLF
jgi:hypothetical protein